MDAGVQSNPKHTNVRIGKAEATRKSHRCDRVFICVIILKEEIFYRCNLEFGSL